MADPTNAAPTSTAPKSRWEEWLLKDTIVSGVVAAALDYAIKKLGPKALDRLSALLGTHITQKYIEDKRAELLDDFRKMETATPPIKLTKLWKRHQAAIDNLSEDRFVILLMKTIADQQDPTKGRQAALKYLNDMDDARFNQALFMLDQDNHVQAFQRMRDRSARIANDIRKGMTAGRNDVTQWLRTNLGAVGNWIVSVLEAIEDSFNRFFNWLSKTPLNTLLIALFLMVIVFLSTRFFRPTVYRTRPRSDFGRKFLIFLVLNLAAGIIVWAFLALLKPTAWAIVLFVILMSITALYCCKRSTMLRNFFLLMVAALCSIACIAALQNWDAVRNKMHSVFAAEQQKDVAEKPVAAPTRGTLPAPTTAPRQNAAPQPSTQTAQVLSLADSAPKTSSESEFVPPPPSGHCALISDASTPVYTYGNYQVTLQHCAMNGTQMMFSGVIQWNGDEKEHHVAFHKFRIYDDSGKTYDVQAGKLGGEKGFGMGYFAKTLDANEPLAFSFIAGVVDPSSPPAKLSLVLPNTQDDLGNVNFSGISEQAD